MLFDCNFAANLDLTAIKPYRADQKCHIEFVEVFLSFLLSLVTLQGLPSLCGLVYVFPKWFKLMTDGIRVCLCV